MLNTGVFIDCLKQNTVLPYLYPWQAYSGFKFDASPATPNSMTNRAQAIAAATAHFDDGHYFHELQRRIAPGQSVVLYNMTNTHVLGGGIATAD